MLFFVFLLLFSFFCLFFLKGKARVRKKLSLSLRFLFPQFSTSLIVVFEGNTHPSSLVSPAMLLLPSWTLPNPPSGNDVVVLLLLHLHLRILLPPLLQSPDADEIEGLKNPVIVRWILTSIGLHWVMDVFSTTLQFLKIRNVPFSNLRSNQPENCALLLSVPIVLIWS